MKIDIKQLIVKEINIDEIDEYMYLYNLVKSNMEYPEWLGDFSKDDYIRMLNNNSKLYIWKYNDKIIAAGMIIPARQKDLDKFFSSNLNYEEVIDFGPELVHPNYVGNGLQNEILKHLQKQSKKLNYKYAISTIHPDNIYSIYNFKKNNFQEIGIVELKRGTRAIFRKELNN